MELPHVGWREWVALPDLGVDAVKAKVDTGARSSALHAFGAERFERDGVPWVRFDVHPIQRDNRTSITCEAPILEYRAVRSSGGHRQVRPVIETHVRLGKSTWPIEVTLTNRDVMGFRMLLGRQAVRNRYVVDPGRSFIASRRRKKKKERPK
jgi:hypothetical protein